MDRIRSLIAGVKPWIESHALGVGTAGLVSLLVGGGIGVAGLVGGGEALPAATTTSTVATVIETTSTTIAGEEPSTTSTTRPAGEGPTLLAVKIDNSPDARPQIGLEEASLVMEVPVEGGLTRFTAFYEQGGFPQVVGPVRSVRPVDADLASAFSSVMVATGGQRFVTGALAGAGVAVATPETAPGFQALERPVPSNLFVDLSQVQSAYPPAASLLEALPRGSLPAGQAATTVTIPYASAVTWEFVDGAYVRSQDGEAFEVLSDPFGEAFQLSTDVVVVFSVAEKSAGYTDSEGVDVATFDVIGSGDLTVFNAGEVVTGAWSRASQLDPYVLSTESGETIAIPEGRVYLAVLPRELTPEY